MKESFFFFFFSFSGDHPVTLGVTASDIYHLISLSRCPERSCFWPKSTSVPPLSSTLSKRMVGTASPPSYIHTTRPCEPSWAEKPPSWFSWHGFHHGTLLSAPVSWERLHWCLCLGAPCLVGDALHKPLCRLASSPAPVIAAGPPGISPLTSGGRVTSPTRAFKERMLKTETMTL